ncbi:uncharacterized protein LOC106645850 [Copidosoma floridanum]|uniref:uncharacterized protein LOC106645850 n=1 Tax=Copidosoma floridanum TaxID=29053 RepID=UPI0006C98C67|nr:uncharacterized protein LOC106645850 [Copidosoma floridanum]
MTNQKAIAERKRQLEEELALIQDLAYGDPDPEEQLTYEDVRNLERNNGEGTVTPPNEEGAGDKEPDNEDDELSDNDVNIYLGEDADGSEALKLQLDKQVTKRISKWSKSGLPKDEKESLSLVPLKGCVDLEPPALNEELMALTQQRVLARDTIYKGHQKLAAIAVASAAISFCSVLDGLEDSPGRESLLTSLANTIKASCELFYQLNTSRKATILVGRFEERIQKMLKESVSTTLLFGDDLKARIEGAKAIEKAAKDMRAKETLPLRAKENFLNKYSSTNRREVGRRSYKGPLRTSSTSRSYRGNSSRSRPTKPFYAQSQPQRNRTDRQ